MKRLVPLMLIAFMAALTMATLPATASEVYVWEAIAEDYDGRMEATYVEEIYEDDTASQVLEVVVIDGPARSQLPIYIEDRLMGMMVTDDTGFGYYSKLRFDVMLDEGGRPDAPRIESGDIIKLEYKDRWGGARFKPLF